MPHALLQLEEGMAFPLSIQEDAHLSASSMFLEAGAAHCWHQGSACFLKQMILFHPRMTLHKIKLCPFHQGYPWTSWNSTPFQKSGFIGIYRKFRDGKAKLDSLCLLPHLLVLSQLLCNRFRS